MGKLVQTKGSKFVDAQGRHTILHGINMVCKKSELGYLNYTEADFLDMKKWGFNIARLGIFWDGLEPEPGKIDYDYIDRIEAVVDMAERAGVSLFLDMHQDLFSGYFKPYGDGAPHWATLTDDLPHYPTDLWSEGYLISPAIQRAFDNFWQNTPAADGVGLQDHYVRLWEVLAERFGNRSHVIGYDIINEPFMGASVELLMGTLLMNLSPYLFPGEEPDMEKLQALWLDPANKESLMARLTEREIFEPVLRSTEAISQQFEQELLNPFFQKVTNAIRAIDKETAIFLETNYFSNMGMKSGVQPVVLANGEKDPNQAYAPHGYDLLVDTPLYDQANNNRVDLIFETHNQVHKDIKIPLLFGEWGCFINCNDTQLPQAAYITDIFEKYLASDTYYDFSHIRGNKVLQVIQRAYPQHVAGEIQSYHYDYRSGEFSATFTTETADPSGSNTESIFYVPNYTEEMQISLTGEATFRVEHFEGANSATIFVKTPKGGVYTLILSS